MRSNPVIPAPAEPTDEATTPRDLAALRHAARLDAQKRSFLRMVSHELRTPLNSILGFSEIISQELYGPIGAPQYKEYATIIRASGERLLKLVNQVVEIARLEAQTMDLDPRPEPLDHALDDVLDSLAEDLRARSTRVEIAGRGDLPVVFADARGLRTVLANLAHNACVYGPEGGVLRVEARRDGALVEVRLTDTGPGVDPNDIPRLLRPFEQGDSALTRRSEGAGLGLPIVDLLCHAMGGRLRLRSAPGEGLTALVRLPAG
jgi:signal transduction histidine kinase